MLVLLLLATVSSVFASVGLGVDLGLSIGKGGCHRVQAIDKNLKDLNCEQPLFVSFAPRSEEIQLIDNICYTLFPLPDDPNTFELYIAKVYCDGSTDINSYITTDLGLGCFRVASPYCTFQDTVFGYAGCDTYLHYRCYLHGLCNDMTECYTPVYGLTPLCKPIGLSCLRKVEEIVRDNRLPEQDYYALPMKLPNRCVTSQICTNEVPIREVPVVLDPHRPSFLPFGRFY